MTKKIAIVGEYNNTFAPHTALNDALNWLKSTHVFEYEWLDTMLVNREKETLLKQFDGIWSAPGSPFLSLDGALFAIEYARTRGIPHLGTCAGFQHGVIEIARNLLGVPDAQHEEYAPDANRLFVSKLMCSLAGKTMDVFLQDGSLASKIYTTEKASENYYCNFGINPSFKNKLKHPDIQITGVDQDGEIRIIELTNHPFFILTLFVPQTTATRTRPHPLINGFLDTVCGKRDADSST